MQTFGPKGSLVSDVSFADWQTVDSIAGQFLAIFRPPSAATPTPQAVGVSSFPRTIRIERPHDDYKLEMQVTKITMNEEIPAERFKIEQPAGAELVHVGDAAENKPQ